MLFALQQGKGFESTFLNVVSSTEETSSTTFFGLYFNHHITQLYDANCCYPSTSPLIGWKVAEVNH